MICHKCKTDLEVEKTKVIEAAHDSEQMELRLTCDKCAVVHYAFVPVAEFVT